MPQKNYQHNVRNNVFVNIFKIKHINELRWIKCRINHFMRLISNLIELDSSLRLEDEQNRKATFSKRKIIVRTKCLFLSAMLFL